jgi:pSer/pThr/pTyr-binding forkhead associated (FHA) protein
MLATQRGDGIVSAATAVAERIAMPVIKLDDQQFLLRPGTNRLGGGDFVELSVSPDVSLGTQAVIEVTGTEGVVIRPAPGKEAIVLVNGVLLTDPTPLLHGDKLEIAGKELSYSDDSKVGSTTFIPKAEIAAVMEPPAPAAEPEAPRPATSASGGRLVSLVDGREYAVPEGGLVIGRESGSDVVVAQKQVSRKHAVITPTLRGYELKDYSSNGVYVNGNKINSSQLIGRADVIRIGKDDFRFYADISALAPTMSFQAFAPKPKSTRETASSTAKRTPSSTHALASRLGYNDKRRGTPHTPAPATTVRTVPEDSRSRFNWMWVVVLLALGFAAYYMLKH